MLDQKWIRGDLDDLASRLLKKGFELDAAYLSSAEQERKASQTQMETLQSERNRSSKAIGQAKARGEDIEPLLAEVATLGERLEAEKAKFEAVARKLQGYLATIPNLPMKTYLTEQTKPIMRWCEPGVNPKPFNSSRLITLT